LKYIIDNFKSDRPRLTFSCGCYRNQPRVIDARRSDTWFRGEGRKSRDNRADVPYVSNSTTRLHSSYNSSAKPKPKPRQYHRAWSSSFHRDSELRNV